MGVAWTITATAAGLSALRLPERKAARTDAQVEHELAIARLVTRFELADPAVRVRTEREARAQQGAGATRCSADVPGAHGAHGGIPKRWPDLILDHADGRFVVELELPGKGSTRLRQILAAYAAVPWFAEVRLLPGSVPIARRLVRLAKTLPASVDAPRRPPCRSHSVARWHELPVLARDTITALVPPAEACTALTANALAGCIARALARPP